MDLRNLFPVEIFEQNITEIDNKKLSEIILEKEITESSESWSNVGGWQSASDLFKDERFGDLVKLVNEKFNEVFEQNNYKDSLSIFLDHLHANVNRFKDFNERHIHLPSTWSFCYYVTKPIGSGNLVFVDPRIRRTMQTALDFQKNFNNTATHDIHWRNSVEGDLLIFPSYIEHYVEPNLTQLPRISISGNWTLRVGE